MSLIRSLKVLPQYCVPQHFLSNLMFRLTRIQIRPIKNLLINTFIRLFNIDMTDYVRKAADDFTHFNDFFTRELLDHARPIDKHTAIVSPVDGAISQFGSIFNGQLLQAKGKDYSLNSLLAQQTRLIEHFDGGEFITIYLSPSNYHRIHMPCSGRLLSMTYVPGDLFAVNLNTADTVDNLFARNERVLIEFDSAHGRFCLIMVGAIFVGSMQTVWQGLITPTGHRSLREWHYSTAQQLDFAKGQELARFNMGSTVILLYGKDRINWLQDIETGQKIVLGQGLGTQN